MPALGGLSPQAGEQRYKQSLARQCTYAACRSRALPMRSHPRGDRIERRTIEFSVVAVCNPNGTPLGLQFRHHRTEFACELLGSIRRDGQVFQDQAALVFAFLANHEIKIVVRHPKVPHFGLRHIIRLSRAVPLVQLRWRTCCCRGVLHFGTRSPHWDSSPRPHPKLGEAQIRNCVLFGFASIYPASFKGSHYREFRKSVRCSYGRYFSDERPWSWLSPDLLMRLSGAFRRNR